MNRIESLKLEIEKGLTARAAHAAACLFFQFSIFNFQFAPPEARS
jgi:hypothetical protein